MCISLEKNIREGFWQKDLFHPRANPRAKKLNFWQKMAKREFSSQVSSPRPFHYLSAAMPTELTLHLSIPNAHTSKFRDFFDRKEQGIPEGCGSFGCPEAVFMPSAHMPSAVGAWHEHFAACRGRSAGRHLRSVMVASCSPPPLKSLPTATREGRQGGRGRGGAVPTAGCAWHAPSQACSVQRAGRHRPSGLGGGSCPPPDRSLARTLRGGRLEGGVELGWLCSRHTRAL